MTAIFDTSQPVENMTTAGRIQGLGCNGAPATCGASAGSAAGSFQPAFAPPSGAAGGFTPPPVDPSMMPKVETGAYSTGKMQGFGNTNYKPSEPSKVSQALGSVAAGLSKMASKPGGPPAGVGMSMPGSTGGYDGSGNGGGYNPTATFSAPEPAVPSGPRVAGQVGGGWGAPSPAPAPAPAPAARTNRNVRFADTRAAAAAPPGPHLHPNSPVPGLHTRVQGSLGLLGSPTPSQRHHFRRCPSYRCSHVHGEMARCFRHQWRPSNSAASVRAPPLPSAARATRCPNY